MANKKKILLVVKKMGQIKGEKMVKKIAGQYNW